MYAEFFGKKLAKARKMAGYTQITAAKELNIPASTIANWEIGRTQPDLESIGIMADFYAISVDWLLGTKGHNANTNPPTTKKGIANEMVM
jgi:transcriptional regulator with XRE-family HTH domain